MCIQRTHSIDTLTIDRYTHWPIFYILHKYHKPYEAVKQNGYGLNGCKKLRIRTQFYVIKMASEASQIEMEQISVACVIHSTKPLELYCKDHELALCRICQILKHKSCTVEAITDAFQNVDVSEEAKEASARISSLKGQIVVCKNNMGVLKDEMSKEKQEDEENIESIRHGLNQVLDRYKEQLNSQFTAKTKSLNDTIQACECLIDQIETQDAALETARGQTVQDIVSLIDAKNMYEEYQHVTEEMEKETKEAKICIREDEMIPDLLQRLKGIAHGIVTESEETDSDLNNTQPKKSFICIQSCTSVRDADIKLPDDAKVPNITGCCYLPDERVVLCDYDNKKIKLLDKEVKIKYTIQKCPGNPRDAANFDENRIVVLYGSDNSFQFVCVKPGIILQEKRSTKMKCYGLNSLAKIIYISGFHLERELYGIALFSCEGWFHKFVGSDMRYLDPYLALNVAQNDIDIFYSGHTSSCSYINKLSSNGHGIYSVCTTLLKKPNSITCDTTGNLLICDTDTKSVHVVDSEGQVRNAVLKEAEDFAPTSMCLTADRDKLIVASRQNDSAKITVYKLKYE